MHALPLCPSTKTFSLIVSLAASLAPSLAAQTQRAILPAGAADRVTATYDSALGTSSSANFPVRLQFAYATGEFPAATASIRQLAFRRENRTASANLAETTTLDVEMDVIASTPAGLGDSFAANLGPSPTRVFSGMVNWPGVANSGPAPAPFDYTVPLTTPYLLITQLGKSLIVDFELKSTTRTAPLRIDAVDLRGGGIDVIHLPKAPCSYSNSMFSVGSGTLSGLTTAGGTFQATYPNLPLTTTMAFWRISAYGPNHPSNPYPLPIEFPGASCNLYIGWEIPIDVPLGFTLAGRRSSVGRRSSRYRQVYRSACRSTTRPWSPTLRRIPPASCCRRRRTT